MVPAVGWKENNPGPKGQVGKEGPGHWAARDRDSEQWLWPLWVSGHKEWSWQQEKRFHDLLHPAQLEAEGPRQAGSKRCQAQTITHHAQPGFLGTAWQQGESLCSPGILGHCQQWPLSGGAWLTPAGKWHCQVWMCHHEPGNCRASAGRGGHSSGGAEKAARPWQAQKEWEEEGLQMGEDAETTPGALA